MNRVAKVGIGALVVTGVTAAVVLTTTDSPISLPQPPPSQAQVAALVDGDTFDVRFDDQITRVRLGDVDTPTPSSPGQPTACLAAQASAQLSSMIPAGTALTLTYDKDRFGRTVAQAVTTDGRLVNAEMVRSGLAQEIGDDSGNPTPPAIEAAARDALANKRGMHSADIACTVPGQVKAVLDQVAGIPTAPAPGADVATLAAEANSATDARMAADELDSDFAQNRQELTWLVLDPSERSRLRAQVESARDRAATAETSLRNATNLTVNQDATQASTQREAARIAKALADIRKAEAERAAEAARREAAARKAAADAAAAAQEQADQQRRDKAARDQADQTDQAAKTAKDKASKDKQQQDGSSSGSSGQDGTGSKSDSGSRNDSGSSGSDGGSGKKRSQD
ncbi:MAG TPA: thermonuclease family protein [Pseudonocardia sp.]|nr:thermonuclease family protein [Pseudonocardia sp.]